MQVKKQQLEPDMEQSTGSKLGKELCQGCILSPCYLTYTYSSMSCKMPYWMNHKLKSRLPGETSTTADDNTRMAESEEESEKAGLKLKIQKTKSMASGPITSWQIYGETIETMTDFTFLGSRITADSDCSHEIKTLAPWKKSCDKPRQRICDKPRQRIKKQRHHFANKGPFSQSYGFSSCHVRM